jgi:hypothetical protein
MREPGSSRSVKRRVRSSQAIATPIHSPFR